MVKNRLTIFAEFRGALFLSHNQAIGLTNGGLWGGETENCGLA